MRTDPGTQSSSGPDPLLALRVLGALACVLAAFLVAMYGLWGAAFLGTSGCEDYGIACRDARLGLAIPLAVAAVIAAVSLLVLAIALLVGNAGRWRIRSAAVAATSVAAGVLLVVLAAQL